MYLALRQSMDTFSAGIETHLYVLGACTLLRICAIQEAIHTYCLAKLHVRLGLVGLLCISIKLYSLYDENVEWSNNLCEGSLKDVPVVGSEAEVVDLRW